MTPVDQECVETGEGVFSDSNAPVIIEVQETQLTQQETASRLNEAQNLGPGAPDNTETDVLLAHCKELIQFLNPNHPSARSTYIQSNYQQDPRRFSEFSSITNRPAVSRQPMPLNNTQPELLSVD